MRKTLSVVGIILIVILFTLGACESTPKPFPPPASAPAPAPTPTLTPTPTPELANTLEDLELIIVNDLTLDQLYAAITPQLKNSSIIYPAQNIVRQSDGKWQFTAKEGGCPGDLDAQFQVIVFHPSPITEPYYIIFFNNQIIIHDAWFEYEAATSIQRLLWTTEVTDPAPAPAPAPTPAPVTVPTPAPTPETKTNREDMIEIFKANAFAKWGNDYQMVNYELDNQTEAYDWVVKQTKYHEIMERAKSEWQNDYEMVKYTYENQVEAYEWIMRQTAYPDIMERAKQDWGEDYEMVKYEYENQVKAYKALQ